MNAGGVLNTCKSNGLNDDDLFGVIIIKLVADG